MQAEQAMEARRARIHVPIGLSETMEKQGYHFVGQHSATKLCNYTSGSLKGGDTCYKHKFYGIGAGAAYRRPLPLGCNLACTFCWRIIPEEEGFKWNELNALGSQWDDPERIVEGLSPSING